MTIIKDAHSFSLPKFTKYEIQDMLVKTEKPLLSPEEEVVYEQILGKTLMKEKHYRLAGKILNIPISEFLKREEETETEKIFYRSENKSFEEEITPVVTLFRFFSEQSKLRGLK